MIAGIGNRQSVDSSDTQRGNVVYQAKAVDIDNAMDKYTNQSEQKFKQSGLTVSVSNSLVDSAQNIDRLIDAAGNTSSQRMKGLAAISAGLKEEALYGEGKQAAKALQTGNLKDVGNTRIQATIGSIKSQSNSQSYSEQSQGSSIQAANNLAIIATGAGKDSNININASDITVGNNALFKIDNDLNISGVAQNEQTRSNNKSSSFGAGAYASTNPGKEGASFGITANASGAKGHANSDGTTYANSHINVGNTTTLDISNDMNVKGGVLTTDELTGQVAGDLNMESLQDTYVYDSKQKNAGFSADIDLSGNAQANSLSISGGKTNIDADYAAVTEQTAIYTQKADLNIGGKGVIKGAAYTTASAEDNKSVFAQGIETSDIQNHSNYDAKAIAAGISIGKAKDTNPQANLNGIGYGTDSDSQTRTTKAAVTGMAGQSDVTTATKDSLNDALENSFDANKVGSKVQADLEITRAFGQEAPKAVAELANKKTQAYKTAQKAVTMLTEDLEDTQDPDKKAYLNQKLQQAKHQLKISEQDYNNWKEGGAYRVAAHTAIGALGAGSLEGALTTGGVAATAPTINDIESKVTDALIAQGMNEQTAKSLSGNLTTLTLASAGATSGLDTASTATAVNVDANNRQLHPVEAEIIGLLAKDYAQHKGISEVEARKRLTRGALYNIDAGWKQSIDTYLSDTPEKIAQYQEAYAYINAVKPTDMNANDWSGELYDKLLSPVESIPQQPEYSQKEQDLIPAANFEKITVTHQTDPKSIDEIYYLDISNNSFTALPEDFNKQTLFMNKAYDDDDTAELYKQSAKMKYGEDIGLKEAALTTVTNTMVIKPLGAISGIDNAVDSNVELVKREWNKSGLEHFNDLVNVSKAVVGSGKEIISNPKQTLDNALDGAKQLKEEATTEWNYRKLKNQQGLPFDTSYKDAQMVGELATDAVMGGGAGKAAKVGKKGLENSGRNLDNLTPPPAYATVSGTPDIRSGATAVTGKPKPDSGIGAAEAGGAILAVSDAPDGSYTRGPDGSMTGPNKGRSTSTGKFDKNGEEIYQRDSGGYYIVDENGIQRSVKSPYTNNGNITQKDNKYDWMDNERHPDPNVTSGFATTKPTPSSNQYFKTEARWQAPGRGTGLNYKVYQQEIDLNARPFASRGDMRTNADLMANGQPPRVLNNGKYEPLHLHHSRQDGRGTLFELSQSAHQAKKREGREALHPYGSDKHPDYPKHDKLFEKDREEYWKDRLNQLIGKQNEFR